ncbi:MAG TPA: hypothetical protein DDX85_01595 [Nitrospiraceae bacterium]|nr:hypothetical protein [Nitrospiraceae bacterium]
MRYTHDVINAEKWNTDLEKSALPPHPDPEKIEGHQNNTAPKALVPAAVNLSAASDDKTTDKDMHEATPDITGTTDMNPSLLSTRTSANRIRRRKKRGTFLLSGLLTGMGSRSRNQK